MSRPVIHNFVASNNIGSIGETLFVSLMTAAGYQVQSVTTDKKYQQRGIDFIVDGVFYDTKFDTKAQSTGNIALETISVKRDGEIVKHGWSVNTEADSVAYIYLMGDEWHMLFFTLKEMQGLVEKSYYDRKVIRNFGYEGEVVLIPIADLTYKKVVKVPILGEVKDFSIIKYIHEYLKNKPS